MTESRPITVDELRKIVLAADKDYAVLVAVKHTGPAAGTQFVTYGQGPEDKVTAEKAARWAQEQLFGPDVEFRVNEHFQVQAARLKGRLDDLIALIDGSGHPELKLEVVRSILVECRDAPVSAAEEASLNGRV